MGSQIEINATAGRVKAGSFEGDGSLLENTPAGADGAAATLAVGTTTPGPAGTTTASVTNSGTSSAAVFDFVIPRGDAGTNGNDGTNYFELSGSDISRSSGNVGIGGAASGTNRLKVHGTVEATAFSVGGTDISSTYATQSALTNGLAGKQASGSYASINGSSSQDFYAKENYAQNWFRVQGNGGIYWTQHGGGWYMNDSTWVRIYNGKSLWGLSLIHISEPTRPY